MNYPVQNTDAAELKNPGIEWVSLCDYTYFLEKEMETKRNIQIYVIWVLIWYLFAILSLKYISINRENEYTVIYT